MIGDLLLQIIITIITKLSYYYTEVHILHFEYTA